MLDAGARDEDVRADEEEELAAHLGGAAQEARDVGLGGAACGRGLWRQGERVDVDAVERLGRLHGGREHLQLEPVCLGVAEPDDSEPADAFSRSCVVLFCHVYLLPSSWL